MHDLIPVTALGGIAPRTETIGTIIIAENAGIALASVAARLGQEEACRGRLAAFLGQDAPAPRAALIDIEVGAVWTGPEQWMLLAPVATHEDLASMVKGAVEDTASVTEQTGAWVVFDIKGAAMRDMVERLCAVPIRRMAAGEVWRTSLHQLGCFVIRLAGADDIRILGPRASAGSLHHALTTAARSVA